jgi:simple sugar transport system permease protein
MAARTTIARGAEIRADATANGDGGEILVNSAVINPEGLSYTLFYASTFVFTGLAVSIAMKAGLFNIGAEGQMYFGGLGLTLLVLACDQTLTPWLLIPLAMIGAAVFGALWAFLPGYLQAKRGSHVVVTTIMFNFIAASLMNFIIVKYLIPEGEQNPASRVFADSAALPTLNTWFPFFGDTPLNIGFLIAIVALVIYGVMVSRSTWGYQLRATGLNQHAAHYAGVRISRMMSGMAVPTMHTVQVAPQTHAPAPAAALPMKPKWCPAG